MDPNKADQLVVRGGKHTSTHQQLVIEFHPCEGDCGGKTAAEISASLENKFLVILTNEKRFDPFAITWNDGRIVKESSLKWFPISGQARLTYELEAR